MSEHEGTFDTHMAVVRAVIISLLVLIVVIILLNSYFFNDKGPWFLDSILNVPMLKMWD